MKNHPIYVCTIVLLSGEVLQEECSKKPELDTQYITNNGDIIRFATIIETNQVIDREFVRHYVTCIQKKPYDDFLIGVTQTKFISCPFGGIDAIKYLEEKLNDFLFENRFTHHILDISYTQSYVVVKYKLKNELDTLKSEKRFESYRKNGIEVKYEFKNGNYFLTETAVFTL